MVALWLQKLLEKIKLRRMSGIPPQYLELKARYRANIKYRDQSLNSSHNVKGQSKLAYKGKNVQPQQMNKRKLNDLDSQPLKGYRQGHFSFYHSGVSPCKYSVSEVIAYSGISKITWIY